MGNFTLGYALGLLLTLVVAEAAAHLKAREAPPFRAGKDSADGCAVL